MNLMDEILALRWLTVLPRPGASLQLAMFVCSIGTVVPWTF